MLETRCLQYKHHHLTPRWDLSALRHPLWWSALVLLLVNDLCLKGRGVAPGWLTGKLSDFAFLIVAPAVCAALLPRAFPGRRVVALCSVTVLYVGAELSPEFSRALLLMAAKLGLHWKLWPDLTDLLALGVLPAAYWLLRERPESPRPRRLWPERTGLIIGTVACLATSAPQGHRHRPFLVNRSEQTVDVRVTWLLSKVDCSALPQDLASTLNAGDLTDAISFSLPPGEVAVLAGAALAGESPVGECGLDELMPNYHCVGAIVEIDGAQPVLMIGRSSWEETNPSFFSCNPPDLDSKCKSPFNLKDDPGPDALSLEQAGSGLEIRGTHFDMADDTARMPNVRIAELDADAVRARPAAAESCSALLEDFESLRSDRRCSRDADCQPLGMHPFPRQADDCSTYVNSESVADIAALAQVWSDACTTSSWPEHCLLQAPGRCDAGACVASCPRGLIPRTCPPTCDHVQEDFSSFCAEGRTCVNELGAECSCVDDSLRCADGPRMTKPCEMPCNVSSQNSSGTAGSSP